MISRQDIHRTMLDLLAHEQHETEPICAKCEKAWPCLASRALEIIDGLNNNKEPS